MVHELARRLAASSPVIDCGIGDDAAVLRARGEHWVSSVDVQVEHVHFERDWLSLRELGARALHVAVSDLAAMGARPLAALSSIVAPISSAARDVAGLSRGQALAARELRCPVVGGNLSSGGELSITLTVLGEASEPKLRAGAKVGDQVWLVGDVGAAAAGLRLIKGGHLRPRQGPAAYCTRAWRAPRAAVAAGRRLGRVATAMIDLSDGLASDAARLARASRKCVLLDEGALRRALPVPLRALCDRQGWDPMDLALHGGEDYALLATGAARERPRGARAIGRVERGREARLCLSDGAIVELGDGYDHFSGR